MDASRLIKSWIRRKDDYTGPQYFHRENIGYMWKWYSMGKNKDYPTSGFAQNMNTRAFNIFTHDMIITYENDIPRGHIRITQNLGLQKIRLHWASIFLPRTEWLHMKMISHGDKPRLPNIWIRRKYDYTGPSYFYPEHKNYIWKWYSMKTNQDYSRLGFLENTSTLGLGVCAQNMRITFGNNIPWGQIKITQHLGSQKIILHWATRFIPII